MRCFLLEKPERLCIKKTAIGMYMTVSHPSEKNLLVGKRGIWQSFNSMNNILINFFKNPENKNKKGTKNHEKQECLNSGF